MRPRFIAELRLFPLNLTETFDIAVPLLLARLESAYSLIWGAQKILGKGGGETLALL